MSNEKLIITMELDEVPEGHALDFSVRSYEDIWINRFKAFKDWKRLVITRIPIKKLEVRNHKGDLVSLPTE